MQAPEAAVVSYGEHADQFGHLLEPPGSRNRPLLVLIHGGFWRDRYRLDLMTPLAEAAADHGFASWNIEYRRVGPSGGGVPATLDDVAAAIDHVGDEWPALAVVGHSAGGHLALWNASRSDAARPPALTVGLAALSDVVSANRNGVGRDATANFFGGDADDVPDRYSAAQPVPDRFAGRVVLIHGADDEDVPVDQSRRLAASVDRYEELSATDHMAMIDPAGAAWQIAIDELSRL